jgi:acyl-CoA thioesterase-1
VTIDYALNDRAIGLERAEQAWVSMILAAQAVGCPVLLLTPTLDAAAADPASEAGRTLDAHAAQIRALAARHGVGLADSTAAWRRQASIGRLLSQSNHPNRAGHALIADELVEWFPSC